MYGHSKFHISLAKPLILLLFLLMLFLYFLILGNVLYCICIMTRGGINNQILPEHEEIQMASSFCDANVHN